MFSLNDGLLFDRLDNPKLCAVIEGGKLVDLWTADDSISGLGSVHLARVTGWFDQHKRLTGQLVDGKAVSWPAKGKNKQRQGQLALVTVTAAARESKPTQAVAGIELVGKYVTLRWQDTEKVLYKSVGNCGPLPSLKGSAKRLPKLVRWLVFLMQGLL